MNLRFVYSNAPDTTQLPRRSAFCRVSRCTSSEQSGLSYYMELWAFSKEFATVADMFRVGRLRAPGAMTLHHNAASSDYEMEKVAMKGQMCPSDNYTHTRSYRFGFEL
jgi:hypothetical protein